MAEKLASLKKVGGSGDADIFTYDKTIVANDYSLSAGTNTVPGTYQAGDIIIIPLRGNPTISNVSGAKVYSKTTPIAGFSLGWSSLIIEASSSTVKFNSSIAVGGYYWILRKS